MASSLESLAGLWRSFLKPPLKIPYDWKRGAEETNESLSVSSDLSLSLVLLASSSHCWGSLVGGNSEHRTPLPYSPALSLSVQRAGGFRLCLVVSVQAQHNIM